MHIRTAMFLAVVFSAVRAFPAGGAPKGCPMHPDCPLASSSGHAHDRVARDRADEGMGFAQTKTIHHFRLRADGGAIELTVREPKDAESLGEVRAHLAHVRNLFAAGDFSVPMFVHGGIPPGTATMRRRAAAIRYRYEEMPDGGRVSLSTADADALDAVHDFLRFQIVEHETGDPTDVGQRR